MNHTLNLGYKNGFVFSGGYCCSNVRGVVDKQFKINEHLCPTGKENLNVWPSLANFDPTAVRQTVQKVLSYDVRKGVKNFDGNKRKRTLRNIGFFLKKKSISFILSSLVLLLII